MLATRVRLARATAIGATVAIALVALVVDVVPPAMDRGTPALARETPVVEPPPSDPPRRARRGCDQEAVHSTDTLQVVLREAPEWTGVDIESDWAKTFRMVWDGPITSWTTMRQVRVPALDHRMIESIEPMVFLGETADARTIRVKVRVVVPGDLEAALAWVAANPAVESARVEVTYVR
ncbi:MAG: hypothetical protein ACKV2T_16620 [Kofleriaceae bacterium]